MTIKTMSYITYNDIKSSCSLINQNGFYEKFKISHTICAKIVKTLGFIFNISDTGLII